MPIRLVTLETDPPLENTPLSPATVAFDKYSILLGDTFSCQFFDAADSFLSRLRSGWKPRQSWPVLLCALLGLSLPGPLSAGERPGYRQQLTSLEQVPERLAKSDWASIREACEAGRHAFQPIEAGWQARNPGQQWTTTFDRRGFMATPKAGGWTWGLDLPGYGFGDHQQTIVGTPAVQAGGPRLTYQWDTAVPEWFVNDQRGLERGFTVSTRPAADTAARTAPGTPPPALSFLLAVQGGSRPPVTPMPCGDGTPPGNQPG